LDIAYIAVNIDNDSNSYCCFSRTHADSEQGEKKAFQFFGKEVSVEYGEVDVYRIQYQFHTDEHGQ
jgi:hypothetical protein